MSACPWAWLSPIAEKKVVLYDIDPTSVGLVHQKKMPFMDEGTPEVLAKMVDSGMLSATTDQSVISKSENIILVIGTPVDEHLNPNLRDVFNAIKDFSTRLKKGQLLILRSTIYPGVTKKVFNYFKSLGVEIHVAFCPERVAEGMAFREIIALPQIVSAYDPEAQKRASNLFSTLGAEIIPLTPEEAELAKLFTNAWRYISFATANQFYMIAESSGLDFYRVYQGMTHHYPRLQGFPQAGFTAGPCLFKDTMQLSAFNKNHFFLGHAAMLINEGLPSFLVDNLKKTMDLQQKTVGILGMAFKANNDDPRDSLAYKLRKILDLEAGNVLCSDIYIHEPGFLTAEELIQRCDVIILATPHREYKQLDLKGKHLVDVWNFFKKD